MSRATTLLAATLLATSAAALPAQTVTGAVAEQLTLAPAAGAVVVLLRVGEDGGLASVAQTLTDDEGLFRVSAPGPGTYRVQADMGGLTTPLSANLELAAPESVEEVVLMLPSALLQMAMTCTAESTEGTAAVVGRIQDGESGVGLPGVTLAATWHQGRRTRRVEGVTDALGRYRLCGVAGDAGEVRLEAMVLGQWGNQGTLVITSPSVVLHDIDVSLKVTAEMPRDVVQEQILLEAAAKTLGDLRGRIVDQRTGAPVPHLVVRLGNTGHQVLTEVDGTFYFQDVRPGSYALEFRSLGYEAASEAVEIPAGKDVFLALRVAPQAVELEGLEVTARTAAENVERVTPFRRDIAYGDIMVEEEIRGARAFETLRRTAPGLRVTEIYREVGPPTLCIQTNRRIQSMTVRRPDPLERPRLLEYAMPGIACDNVQVVVDGMKIPDGSDFLRRTPASEIESIEFLSPVQAQILYGTGGSTSNGVVVVYTRGRGPYVSPLRNREVRR